MQQEDITVLMSVLDLLADIDPACARVGGRTNFSTKTVSRKVAEELVASGYVDVTLDGIKLNKKGWERWHELEALL